MPTGNREDFVFHVTEEGSPVSGGRKTDLAALMSSDKCSSCELRGSELQGAMLALEMLQRTMSALETRIVPKSSLLKAKRITRQVSIAYSQCHFICYTFKMGLCSPPPPPPPPPPLIKRIKKVYVWIFVENGLFMPYTCILRVQTWEVLNKVSFLSQHTCTWHAEETLYMARYC